MLPLKAPFRQKAGGRLVHYMLQYSIYAGCHVVPGLDGLLNVQLILKECVEPPQCACVVINSLVDNLISRIQVCFCSNNCGDH